MMGIIKSLQYFVFTTATKLDTEAMAFTYASVDYDVLLSDLLCGLINKDSGLEIRIAREVGIE